MIHQKKNIGRRLNVTTFLHSNEPLDYLSYLVEQEIQNQKQQSQKKTQEKVRGEQTTSMGRYL